MVPSTRGVLSTVHLMHERVAAEVRTPSVLSTPCTEYTPCTDSRRVVVPVMMPKLLVHLVGRVSLDSCFFELNEGSTGN